MNPKGDPQRVSFWHCATSRRRGGAVGLTGEECPNVRAPLSPQGLLVPGGAAALPVLPWRGPPCSARPRGRSGAPGPGRADAGGPQWWRRRRLQPCRTSRSCSHPTWTTSSSKVRGAKGGSVHEMRACRRLCAHFTSVRVHVCACVCVCVCVRVCVCVCSARRCLQAAVHGPELGIQHCATPGW